MNNFVNIDTGSIPELVGVCVDGDAIVAGGGATLPDISSAQSLWASGN